MLPYIGCFPSLARPSRSHCLWAIQMCVHSGYVPLFYDGCCLSELISLSVREPSAVCQAPCLSSMLISINYYSIWSWLVVWCCESHTSKSELDWKPFNAVLPMPSFLVNNTSSVPCWVLSWAAQGILHHLSSSFHRTEQLVVAWPPQYPMSLDTDRGRGWTHDSTRAVGERRLSSY